MATLNDTSALKALNEQNYINKLYDTNTDTQKKLLEQNYTDNTGVLNSEQNRVQQQTQENVNRTQVEANSNQNTYNGPKLTLGANVQADLARDNAQQGNVTSLNQRQQEADAEIERQRQLLASQYATAIKQAQADNDMERAQALYSAAKDEEAKLLSLRQAAGSLLASKGDTSIQDSILRGEAPSADYSGETWEQVLKNEAALNGIYDKQLESQLLGLQMENEEAMSDLQAERQQAKAKTDEALTDAYVDSLRKAKNYAEVQNAYGMGSGAFGQAQLAQDLELQRALTELRLQRMDTDASLGMEGIDIGKAYRDQVAKATAEINRKRAEELFKAADQEEETLYNTQLQIGQELAKQNNYSVLGLLYGLTQDQIDRIQGTGKYAPVVYYEEESSTKKGKPSNNDDSDDKYYGGRDGQNDWANQTLQNMANTGIAIYEENRAPLSSAAKKESNNPTVVRGRTSSSKKVM